MRRYKIMAKRSQDYNQPRNPSADAPQCYFCLTLKDVELPLIRRNLKFSMIFVPYLIGRYMAAVLSILIVWTHSGNPDPRHGPNPIIPVLNICTVVFSSMNISFRPFVLWKAIKLTWYFLLLLLLGHIGLGLATGFGPLANPPKVRGGQVSNHGGPPLDHIIPQMVLIFYIYTILFDTIILVLTIRGLSLEKSARKSPLWIKLRTQGVQYLIAAMIVNLPMVVLGFLDLNPIMDLFFAGPGEYTTSERVISGDKGVGVLLYSVMASSSAVIALLKLREHTCVSCCLCQHEVGIPHTTTSSTPTSGVLTTRIGLPPSIADQSHSSQRPLMP
ncbi:hypothetical protein NLI96_g12117 [Meripilus lineatus]|uniref:Uncharacterized protein n=1 Tax=Meripilus lineatus TaxID=2056292 RepID=A0AAD5UUK7_9APHY|nr:hypothetical protein NLI96_g12117 [Physisporinus lineatus]